jgi:hypothetical protein
MNTRIDWIPAGQTFALDDLVFWQGKGRAPFSAIAARIDTIVLGPHASARFPAELQPFVDAALTRRKQYDYSDVITSSLGRAWAAADPGARREPRSARRCDARAARVLCAARTSACGRKSELRRHRCSTPGHLLG